MEQSRSPAWIREKRLAVHHGVEIQKNFTWLAKMQIVRGLKEESLQRGTLLRRQCVGRKQGSVQMERRSWNGEVVLRLSGALQPHATLPHRCEA
jgi:hypothetical protein